MGRLGGSVRCVQLLISAQVMISGSRDAALRQDQCSAGSPPETLSLPLPLPIPVHAL